MTNGANDYAELDKKLSLNNNHAKYEFPLIVKNEQYSRIHPVKQQKVHSLVNALLNSNYEGLIEMIIVFGSCLTLHCSSYSDIDLIVLGEFEDFNPDIELYQYGEVDLFGYNTKYFFENLEHNKFYKKVWEGGYKIYEQLSTFS